MPTTEMQPEKRECKGMKVQKEFTQAAHIFLCYDS